MLKMREPIFTWFKKKSK